MSDTPHFFAPVPVQLYSDPEFDRDALREFPDIADYVERCEGIHMVMGALHRLAASAIDQDNTELFDRIGAFLAEVLNKPDVDTEIENAVEISFLEYRTLVTSRKGREAFNCLPDSIKTILVRQNY